MPAKKILVVDDEPDAVVLLSIRLKSCGYDVISAPDGKACLKKAVEENPDLIILDILMPEINGLEVCRCLKKSDRTKDIPVIMLTAKGSDTDKVVGRVIGADYYIAKPFNPEDLLSKMKTALAEKNKR